MLNKSYPLYVANEARSPNQDLEVTNKYTQEVATRVALGDGSLVEEAIAAAHGAAEPMARLKAYERQAVLQRLVDGTEERRDEFAQALCVEAGKPVKDARGEVTRLIDTFRICAEEAVRMYGEIIPLDISERAANYQGMWKPVPVGPCSFITPFNFPLNLVAHKVGPALAAGCPFVLKPAGKTPIGALLLGEILAETDLPKGAFSILPLKVKDADPLVEDNRLKKLSFTGSADVGWELKRRAGKKHVTLELGGNAPCIVHEDADIDDAVERIVMGGYYQSGQSCISVQRLYVQRSVYDAFKEKFVAAVKDLKAGDPLDDDTFIGPIISEDDAKRIEAWVSEAVDGGGNVLCGGKRDGVMYSATVIEKPPDDSKVIRDEVFGPVVALMAYDDFDDALAKANDANYGLQAGVFTRDVFRIQHAWDTLEYGGVLINEVPSWRVDHMPYGGVKDSGFGREGIRWAMQSMTEPRLLVLRTP